MRYTVSFRRGFMDANVSVAFEGCTRGATIFCPKPSGRLVDSSRRRVPSLTAPRMSAPFADLRPSPHRRPFYDTAARPPPRNVGQPHGWPGISRFSGAVNSMGERPETRAARRRRRRMDSALEARSCPSRADPYEVVAPVSTPFRSTGYGELQTRADVCWPLAPSVPRPPPAVPAGPRWGTRAQPGLASRRVRKRILQVDLENGIQLLIRRAPNYSPRHIPEGYLRGRSAGAI